MVLCDASVISNACKFLGQNSSPGNVTLSSDGEIILDSKTSGRVKGFATVLETIIKGHKTSPDLLPNNAEEFAQLRQWLEFCISVVNFGDSQTTALKTLNDRLSRVNFLVGSRVTVADAILFFTVYPVMSSATMQEKENLSHLSRWFSTVQHYPGFLINSNYKLLTFSRNHLYKR